MNRYLKPQVTFGWSASVFVLLATAITVNGGFGLHRSAIATSLLITTLLGSAAFAFALVCLPPIQHWALRDGADIRPARRAFLYVAVFSGCVGLGILIDATLNLP